MLGKLYCVLEGDAKLTFAESSEKLSLCWSEPTEVGFNILSIRRVFEVTSAGSSLRSQGPAVLMVVAEVFVTVLLGVVVCVEVLLPLLDVAQLALQIAPLTQ